MSPSPYWPDSTRPHSGGALVQLHGELVQLGGRLRQAVAQAVGRAAAAFAGRAALGLLDESESGPTPARPPAYLPRLPTHFSARTWEDFGDRGGDAGEASWHARAPRWGLPDEADDEGGQASLRPGRRVGDRSCLSPWRQLLTAALQALAWWCRRLSARRPLPAALGFGLACGLALLCIGGASLAGGGAGIVLALLTDLAGAATALRPAAP